MNKTFFIVIMMSFFIVSLAACSSVEESEHIDSSEYGETDEIIHLDEVAEDNLHSNNTVEMTPAAFTHSMCDEVWASTNMEHSRFQTMNDFVAQVDYYIRVVSEFVSRENWYEYHSENESITHIEYRLTDEINHVIRRGNQFYVYLNQGYFEHDLAPIAHEIAHVIVPFHNKSLSLSEGLASYIQHKFGHNPSLFNFGLDPHIVANLFFTYQEDVYNRIFPVIGTRNPLQNQFARGGYQMQFYVLSHSFAQFLINTFGIERFMSIHDSSNQPNDYYAIFGKSFDDIKSAWHDVVESSPSITMEEYQRYLFELFERHNMLYLLLDLFAN